MILGVGTDLIEMRRIEKACGNKAFLMRYFTVKERKFIQDRPVKAAGNFAVKEAVAKVLGTGFSGFYPADIEVLRDPLGKPYVVLYGKAKEIADRIGITRIHVSITNTKEYASAYAIGEGYEISGK